MVVNNGGGKKSSQAIVYAEKRKKEIGIELEEMTMVGLRVSQRKRLAYSIITIIKTLKGRHAITSQLGFLKLS